MTTHQEEVLRGVAEYTPKLLRRYDRKVLRRVVPFVWRASRRQMLALYNRNVGARHADVGPGTGYFLEQCRFPVTGPRVVCLDLNENVLHTVAARLAHLRPELYVQDALLPWDFPCAEPFDSVGMNMLLHCVPGSIEEKAVAFDHAAAATRPGGRIFGTTVLTHGVRQTPLSRRFLKRLNGKGVFHNADDSFEALHAELERRFPDFRLRAMGSFAYFEATVPDA